MDIKVNLQDYLTEEEIKEAMTDGIKEYTREKCQKFLDTDIKGGYYKTLFESVCLGYMLDNYKEEVDFAVDACLKYITTVDLFKPRWSDYRNTTNELFQILKVKMADSSEEFKDAILDRIKNTDEDNLREILIDVVDENLSRIFTKS